MKNSFKKFYNRLNEQQKKAVDAIYGPVLVLAGPGSGKTELLAVRIANILQKTDASASNILCVTFTENAAKNMRERLRKIIGQEAYKVAIHTFHTFGMEILSRFQYKLKEENELEVIDDITASKIFHKIMNGLEWNNPWKKSFQLPNIRSAIADLKNAGISPQDFENILLINEQILNNIGPIIKDTFGKIATLGRKKEDISQKMQLFSEIGTVIENKLSEIPKQYKFHETLASTILESIQEVIESGDSKMLTKWKNSYTEKNHKNEFILKDVEKMNRSMALLDIYKKYSEQLQKKSLIDFSDMILRANKILEIDDTVRMNIAEQYQWILLDEYQDTNDAQLELIRQVTEVSDTPNIFAVGDDDQSIFKFQGANTKNLKLFKQFYEDTQLIILNTNYRSKEEIINFSRQIISDQNGISKIFEGAKKEFIAHRGIGGNVRTLKFNTEISEIDFITSEISDIIENEKNNTDFSLNQIAVITKKNATLENIAKVLLSKKIPVQLSKDENIFNNEVVILLKNILLYIYSLQTGMDCDDILVQILSHPMWKLHRLDIWEISRKIAQSRKSENKIWIEELRKNSNRNISKIAHFLIECSIKSQTMRLEDIIDIVVGTNNIELPSDYEDEGNSREQIILSFDNEKEIFVSPLYEYYFSEEKSQENPLLYQNHLLNIRKIIESIRSYKKQKTYLVLKDFVEYINLIDEYNILLTSSQLIGSPDAVQCITAHKSKGLEYKYVFAVGMTQKNYTRGGGFGGSSFPSNFQISPEKDENEDIERLVYTICTRAEDELIVTYAEKNLSEKNEALLSVLGNIEKWEYFEQLSNNNCSYILKEEQKNILGLPFTGDENKFLQNIISSNFALSVTALQNFLNVADGGPAHFISNNILHFPQAKSVHNIYGTAIHKALEDFFNDYKIKKSFNKSILITSFTNTFLSEGLDEDTEKEFLSRGLETFETLYPLLKERPYGELHLEHRFNFQGGGTYLSDIRLNGAIDRIEITSDNRLIVTDYKTGDGFDNLESTSRTPYEAIKKWKYDLQLIFYAILFEESPRWNFWKQREFRLLFVEKNKKTGEIYDVVKFPQASEIERTKQLIKVVAEHITNLNFPDISAYSQDIKGIRQFEEDLLEGKI